MSLNIPLLDRVTAALENHEIHYHVDEETQVLSGSLRGDNGTWRFLVEVIDRDGERGVIVVSFLPVNVAPNRRTAVAGLLNRINFTKAMAFFAMDADDGELVCKSGIDLADGELSPSMFDALFLLNAQLMDHYLPAILQVSYGSASPDAALAALDMPCGVLQ